MHGIRLNSLSLLDFARTNSFGPVALGAKLSTIANLLGPPRRWLFEAWEPPYCYMAFGEIEVGFVIHGDDYVVEWAKLWPSEFRSGVQPFLTPQHGKATVVSNPFRVKSPSLDEVRGCLGRSSISFTTDYLDNGEVTTVLSAGDERNVHFYFPDKTSGALGDRLLWVTLSHRIR